MDELSEAVLVLTKMLAESRKEINVVRGKLSCVESRVTTLHEEVKQANERCHKYIEQLQEYRAPKGN